MRFTRRRSPRGGTRGLRVHGASCAKSVEQPGGRAVDAAGGDDATIHVFIETLVSLLEDNTGIQ